MSNYTPLYALAASLVPKESKIIELGCGKGEFAQILGNENKTDCYTGIDIDRPSLQEARKNNPIISNCFVEGDITNLIFEEVRTFIALEVMEHIIADIAVLSKLPVGSRVILSVPSFDSVGHVRFFPKNHEAIERYSKVMDVDLWRKIRIPIGGGFFHLLRGYK